jgi:hypothetical protein
VNDWDPGHFVATQKKRPPDPKKNKKMTGWASTLYGTWNPGHFVATQKKRPPDPKKNKKASNE